MWWSTEVVLRGSVPPSLSMARIHSQRNPHYSYCTGILDFRRVWPPHIGNSMYINK